MKSLTELVKESLLNEAKFDNKEFYKYNYKYAKQVIDALLKGEAVKLGPTGKDGYIYGDDLTDKQIDDLKMLLTNIDTSSPQDFNDIVKGTGIKWGKIFKGAFSGYADGLASKNKGNAFEAEFYNNFSEYEDDVKNILGYTYLNDKTLDGGKNTPRKLTFHNDGYITAGNITSDFNIGSTITDITLDVDDNKKEYLSLKSTNTTTFINTGIKKLFPKTWFKGEADLPENGKKLLDLLYIDENRFKHVFNNYIGKKAKSDKEEIDITDSLNNSNHFKHFLYSCIGYGYLLVHEGDRGGIDYVYFKDEDFMKNLVKKFNKAVIKYPIDGHAKRIDIEIDCDDIELKLNIRSKTGDIYPTHLMLDYKFKKKF